MKKETLQFNGNVKIDGGSIDLFANEFGVIDEYGGIFIRGALTDSLPQFLEKGRILLDHDESILTQIGMPQTVTEKADGLYITGDLHTTAEAQAARTILKERLDNRKYNGVSIGFLVTEHLLIAPSEYDRILPQYIRPEKYAEQRKLADEFPYLYVRLKAELDEVSIVTRPANKNSHVRDILSVGKKAVNGILSKYLGNIDASLCLECCRQCMDAFMWCCVYECCCGMYKDSSHEEKMSIINEGCKEMCEYIMKCCDTMMDSGMDMAEEMSALFIDPRISDSNSGVTLNTQLKQAIGLLSHISTITSRAESIASRNQEQLEGKMLSKINLGELKDIRARVDALINKAEPVEDLRSERIKALEIFKRLN